MRSRTRLAASLVGVAALAIPLVTASSAGASDSHHTVTANITGGDHFLHPGLLVNDYSFPQRPLVVEKGGTIVFKNLTDDGHTIVLVANSAEPHTTKAVDACEQGGGGTVCDAVNGVFFGANGGPGSLPLAAQVLNGAPNTTVGAPDAAALANGGNLLPPGFPPLLVESLNNKATTATAGDGTIIAPPGQGPTERTVTAPTKAGVYQYMCTLHPWMQGTIIVTS